MEYIDIIIQLRKVIRAINLESKKIEKKFGISIPQLLVLQFIHEQKDHQTSAKEIKKFINLNASTVSGIVARLETKGFISRSHKSDDKRTQLITLTSKSFDLLKITPTAVQAKVSGRLAQLTTNQLNDLKLNIELLTHIVDVDH